MLSDIKHKLMCITSKLQIKQSNGISNPTFENSHLNSNLYILQNRLNRCLQTIPVKDYIFFDIRHERISWFQIWYLQRNYPVANSQCIPILQFTNEKAIWLLFFYILWKIHENYTFLCIINYFIVKKDKRARRQDCPKRRFYAC